MTSNNSAAYNRNSMGREQSPAARRIATRRRLLISNQELIRLISKLVSKRSNNWVSFKLQLLNVTCPDSGKFICHSAHLHRTRYFSDINISQSSVATRLRWWVISWSLCCKFPGHFDSEKISKISHYMTKLFLEYTRDSFSARLLLYFHYNHTIWK